MRRLLIGLAIVASLSVAVVPAMAATTFHSRQMGTGVGADFSNIQFDADGNFVPGSYWEAYVEAATWMTTGDETWQEAYACAYFTEFTIDEVGNWYEDSSVSGCAPYELLTIDRTLSSARLVATIPAEGCISWAKRTGECREWGIVGTFDVDLTFTGVGSLRRWHGTDSGGTAGLYQYTSHGTGSDRDAAATGSFRLAGASIIDGASYASGWMFATKNGSFEVDH